MRTRQARNLAAIATSMLLLASGFNNCGQRTRMNAKDATLLATASLREGGGSTGGNPARTALRFGPYGIAGGPLPSSADRPTPGTGDDSAPPPPVFNQALLSFFSVCASTFHFYPADGSPEFDLQLNRDILVLPDGTPISDFDLPDGSYERITIVLADTCGSGRSFEVTNALGTIISKDPVTMEFDGTFSTDDRDTTLDVSVIASTLSSAASEQDVLTDLSVPAELLPFTGGVRTDE